jgi:hypothetical protein
MIYLIDRPPHSDFIRELLADHTKTTVQLVTIPDNPTIGTTAFILRDLIKLVTSTDIVLCAWGLPPNPTLTSIFGALVTRTNVVAAAGNDGRQIDTIPALITGVTTVGALNKSGDRASHSNYSDKPMVWVTGTNYQGHSGTSVSAALYAAFLSRAIAANDPTLTQKLIDQRKQEALDELR